MLDAFSPPVRDWFLATYCRPTPPQEMGWPPIQRGEHTLILSPTGSGKTLTAFLWGIDVLFRELAGEGGGPSRPEAAGRSVALGSPDSGTAGAGCCAAIPGRPATEPGGSRPGAAKPRAGVRLVYVSPLKALNNDIHRNLRLPLSGIRHLAGAAGTTLPEIRIAVRSGDTPPKERRAVTARPPHVLITTPESLYLMLTGPRAREMFRTVHTVVVDEIHTLAGNKRGVHLSLTLERLVELADGPVQRIGLSATIRPLEEVARFLGGAEWVVAADGDGGATGDGGGGRTGGGAAGAEHADARPAAGALRLRPRPVTIVDAGYHKPLDLLVETVVDDYRSLPGDSLWPVLIPRILELIRQHGTTLVFANSRRMAERTADRLNEQRAAEARGEDSGLLEGGAAKGQGMMAAGSGLHQDPIRAHHGSMAKEARLDMERDLKAGRLQALVGTSSLQLGIDIGSIDLVVQLESPKAVSQGLQRVGRSGHLVGQTSRGRIFPLHREDLMEAAVVAGGMLRGEVEPTFTPRNCLDILAQQVVAVVAVEDWDAEDLHRLVRRAYAFSDLSRRAFDSVLEMLSGRYPATSNRELRARLSWDRVNDRLLALPGSRLLAVTNGGTIADRGNFAAYLPDGRTRIGELDEEFVFETRAGDTFMLGAQVWRVLEITDDRLVVTEAPGAPPRMPFWHGDYPWRPYELGRRVGGFRRLLAERLKGLRTSVGAGSYRDLRSSRRHPAVRAELIWLQEHYALDERSAWQVLDYVASQLDKAGAIASDTVLLVEVFDDALGDPRMVLHSPFGGRVNGPWGLALASALRERTGARVEVQTNDDGILMRFPDSDAEFPLHVVSSLGPEEARRRILGELPESAVFGARFRQNASRALLLPGLRGGKRTPFWLQRLRAKDLLSAVRAMPDFPLLAETYRDCLEDVMDLPHMEQILADIRDGRIDVTVLESVTPSPVAQSLMWDFINVYMYEGDAPSAERRLQALTANADLLQDLLKDVRLDRLLRPEALSDVGGRLQCTAPGFRARTLEELAVLLQEMGDLSATEAAARSAADPQPWLDRLGADGRVTVFLIPTAVGMEPRWVPTELLPEYEAAFGPARTRSAAAEAAEPAASAADDARGRILDRLLAHSGPLTVKQILERYLFPCSWLERSLQRLVQSRRVARGAFTPLNNPADDAPPTTEREYVDVTNLEQIHRHSLATLRRQVQPVPFSTYAEFLSRWQHVDPRDRLAGPRALREVLGQLRSLSLPGLVWERDVLPLRLSAYRPSQLDTLCRGGEVAWVVTGGAEPRHARVRFLFRGEGDAFLSAATDSGSSLSPGSQRLLALFRAEGALFPADLRSALGLDAAALDAGLVELVMAGLVNNDSPSILRNLVAAGATLRVAPAARNSPAGPLAAQLAERLGDRRPRPGRLGRPSHQEIRSAERRVRQRLEGEREMETAGRWAPVHRLEVMGPQLGAEERDERRARLLLQRYGVVSRESLEAEEDAWGWPALYQQLQRMEMRGRVRRGYFVRGLPGVQFALPEAVERLREVAAEAVGPLDRSSTPPTVLNACDPANLYGPAAERILPARRDLLPHTQDGHQLAFARVPSTWMVQRRGLPILLAEDTGSRLTAMAGADDAALTEALPVLLRHLSRFAPRVTAALWNGSPVLESTGRRLLESAGFYPDAPGMVWED